MKAQFQILATVVLFCTSSVALADAAGHRADFNQVLEQSQASREDLHKQIVRHTDSSSDDASTNPSNAGRGIASVGVAIVSE